nr:penicillin-insensitive murein endopeptidase [Methyloligella sp. GL2]
MVPSAAETTPAPDKDAPAKELFASVSGPANMQARSIGFYSKGCLAGGKALPINGPDWQVMRLSRNRNWGHPELIAYLERLASDAQGLDGWPGLLVGDLSQPRGGPMITGHTSHQVGLDADIWLTPMPDRILTSTEREEISAVSMLKDPFTVDPDVWTPGHTKLLKRAASYPQVARIFVHPAIKKQLCEDAGADRAWLGKIRPWWGHFYHFHVRLSCPAGMEGCENQPKVSGNDDCGAPLNYWFDELKQAEINKSRMKEPAKPAPPRRGPSLDDLPDACTPVLMAGGNDGLPAPGEPSPMLKAMASKDAGPPAPSLSQSEVDVLTGKAPAPETPVPMPTRAPR